MTRRAGFLVAAALVCVLLPPSMLQPPRRAANAEIQSELETAAAAPADIQPGPAEKARVKRLTAQLQDPDWFVRQATVRRLGEFGDERAIPALDRMVAADPFVDQSGDYTNRDTALQATWERLGDHQSEVANPTGSDIPQLRFEVKQSLVDPQFRLDVSLVMSLFNDGDEPVMVYWGDHDYDDVYRFRITRGDGKEIPPSRNQPMPPVAGLDPKYFKELDPGERLVHGMSLTELTGSSQRYYFREAGEYIVEPSFAAVVASPKEQPDGSVGLEEVWQGILYADPIVVTIAEPEPSSAASQLGNVSIAGQVVDTAGGPIAGVEVIVDGLVSVARARALGVSDDRAISDGAGDDRTISDADGWFWFTRLPDHCHSFLLRATHLHYHSTETTLVHEPPKTDYDVQLVMDPGITVRGTVVDEVGNPVAGARVRRNDRFGPNKTYTDEAGNFQLSGVVPDDGFVSVDLWKRGYRGVRNQRAVEAEAQSGNWQLTLSREDSLTLSGQAVFADGTPAADMQVHFLLRNQDDRGYARGTTTDVEGQFTSVVTEPGTFSGSIWLEEPAEERYLPHGRWQTPVDGITPGRHDIELVFENRGQISVNVEPANALPPSREFQVACTIVGPRDKSVDGVVASATVGAEGGTAVFENLSPGSYKVEVKDVKARHWTWSKNVVLPDDTGSLDADVLFPLPELHFGSVRARVLEPDGTTPVKEGRIWLDSPASWGMIDFRDGRIEIDEVPAGNIWLSTRQKRYIRSTVTGVVRQGETTDLGDIVLVPEEVGAGWVEGRILFDDGTPALGAELNRFVFARATIGPDGRFRAQLPVGARMLLVDLHGEPRWPRARLYESRSGYSAFHFPGGVETIIVPVDVKSGVTVTKDIVIPHSTLGTVHVECRGIEGGRLRDTLVVECGGQLFACQSLGGRDELGSFVLEDVPTGTRILILRTDNYCGYLEDDTGEPDTVFTFDPDKTGSIVGKVLLEAGRPVKGGAVKLWHESLVDLGHYRMVDSGYVFGPSGMVASTDIDEHGSFTFPKVVPGRYVVETGQRGPSFRQTIEVEPGRETNVELTTIAPSIPQRGVPPLRESPGISGD